MSSPELFQFPVGEVGVHDETEGVIGFVDRKRHKMVRKTVPFAFWTLKDLSAAESIRYWSAYGNSPVTVCGGPRPFGF